MFWDLISVSLMFLLEHRKVFEGFRQSAPGGNRTGTARSQGRGPNHWANPGLRGCLPGDFLCTKKSKPWAGPAHQLIIRRPKHYFLRQKNSPAVKHTTFCIKSTHPPSTKYCLRQAQFINRQKKASRSWLFELLGAKYRVCIVFARKCYCLSHLSSKTSVVESRVVKNIFF